MMLKPRKDVPDVPSLCEWAATAPAGEFVVSNVGNLCADRTTNSLCHRDEGRSEHQVDRKSMWSSDCATLAHRRTWMHLSRLECPGNSAQCT